MTTDDPSRYAPPLELRIPLSTLVDSAEAPAAAASPLLGEAPAPHAIANASPGAGTGALTPLAAPTLPDPTDPSAMAQQMARWIGQHLVGASIVPAPLPQHAASGVAMPGQAATPGASATLPTHPAAPYGEPTLSPSGFPSPTATETGISLAPAQLEVPSAHGAPSSPSAGGGLPTAPSAPAFAGGPAVPALESAAPPSNPYAASTPSYRHGGSDAGGFSRYGAPPDLDAFLSLQPTAQGMPSFDVSLLDTRLVDGSHDGAAHGPAHTTNVTHAAPATSAAHAAPGAPPAHAAPAYAAPSNPHVAHAAHTTNSAHAPHATNAAHAQPATAYSPTLHASPAPTTTAHAAHAAPSNAAPPPAAHDDALDLGITPTWDVAPNLPAFADLPGLPTSPTGDYAPKAPEASVSSLQLPASGRGPSAPLGSPEVPSSSIVPASSPFAAPFDLPPHLPPAVLRAGEGRLDPAQALVNPGHAVAVPTWTEPSTRPAYANIVSGDDPRMLRELGRVAFDPYAVRKDFPILEERVHGGKPLVWLDNAATTQKPRQVIERIAYFYEHENSNVHRAAHTLAARSTDAFERAREAARRFINAPSSKEIVWVRGATEGINLIAKTWGKKFVGKGDEIVITHLEHHANIVPWQMLCAEVGAKLRVAPVDDRGDVILEKYEALMGPRTRLVSIPHVSNALGTITPTKQMVEIAHRYGAHVMVDGAQAVSHMKVDVQDLGCDWYVFSGHKVYAPTGIGVVWGTQAVLDTMPPWQGGGNMIEDVTFEHTRFHPPPWRFEAGTGSIGDAVGLGAAIEYVERIGMDVIDRYEHELLVYGTQRLLTVPGLRIIGTSKHKAGVLSFVLEGQRTEDVSAILDKDGIAVRSGHHCAQPILRRYGLEATVRASLAFYNVCEDIDVLVESLHRLQAGRVR